MARNLPRLKNGPYIAALSLVAALVTNCGEPPAPSFTENVYRPGPTTQNAERLSADAVAIAKRQAELERPDSYSSQDEATSGQHGTSKDGLYPGSSGQATAQNQSSADSKISQITNSSAAADSARANGSANGGSPSANSGGTQSADTTVEDGSAGAESAPSWARNQSGSGSSSSTTPTPPDVIASNNGQGSSGTGSSGTGSSGTGSSGAGSSGAGSSGAGSSGTGSSGAGSSGSGSSGSGSSGAGSSGAGSSGSGSSGETTAQDTDIGSDSGNSGNNANPPTSIMVTQSLIQPAKRPVDILWIVDTSGSMEEEQKYLASNFQSFITAIKNSGINFHTALTSTDVCDPSGAFNKLCPVDYGGSAKTHLQGTFVGSAGRKVLKDSDSDLISKFTSYANMGISGSGFEHGLTAAAMAVSKSLSGLNESLIRPESFLSIIVVSDEEDDGIGMSKTDENGYNFAELGLSSYHYTHNDFIAELNKTKGPGNFAVTAITGTKNADGKLCTSPHSKPYEEGSQYINAAKATGGLVQSICETNWSKSLTNIGQDLTAQISQISLEKTPESSSITVEINGVVVNDWQYVTASNAIKFSPNAIPLPGASIKVSYLTAP